MRVLIMALIIFLNYLLQSTLLPSAAVFGVTPDTALAFIVSYAVMRGDVEGAAFGFAAGLTQDVFGGYFVGLYALLGLVAGYFCGKPFKDFFKDNFFLPFLVVFFASFAYQFMFYCAAFLFTGRADFPYLFATIILPKTIYTVSVSVPVYALLYLINSRLETYEKNRRSLFE